MSNPLLDPVSESDYFLNSTSSTYGLSVLILAIITYMIYKTFFGYNDLWSMYGVKQPNIGNSMDMRNMFSKLLEEYDDTVGMTRPINQRILLTRDTHLLNQIMVKNFNNFLERPMEIISKSPVGESVFFAKHGTWKRLRNMISPSFTTGKLKLISKSVEESAERLADYFVSCAKTGRLIPVKKITTQYTSEVIAKTAFGFQTEGLGGEDDQFTSYSRKLVKIRGKFMSLVNLFVRSVPRLQRFLTLSLKIELFDPIDKEAADYFTTILGKTIPERKDYERSGNKVPSDLLQMLVATQKSRGDKQTETSLTDNEIIGQSMLIIFAAFETAATTLTMLSYFLAKHPEIQEKLYEEIQEVVTSHTPTHEELGNLKYMGQVIDETLRLFPPIPFISRRNERTQTYDKITIPARTIVLIPIFSIHRDPKHWPNPDTFDPERFTDKAKQGRDPMAFMPFGYGPRICVGQRMAYLELKLALVHSLRKVKFVLNDRTEPKKGEEVKLSWQALVSPEKPVEVACLLRKEMS